VCVCVCVYCWVRRCSLSPADGALQVSFAEGDIITNVQIIDEGWMRGTVERTGATGMLPSNYVEPV
jgi:hypothetical protein